jgi:hypothetical protein
MRRPRTEMLGLLAAGGCFTGAFVAAFAVGFGLSYVLIGPASFEGMLEQLAYRMHGSYLDRIDTGKLDEYVPFWREYVNYPMAPLALFVGKLIYSSDGIGYGSRVLGGTAIAGAFVVFCLYFGHQRRRAFQDHQVVVMLSSVLVVVGWYALFFQHSIIHTVFMVRLLVWPIGVAIFLMAVLICSSGRRVRGGRELVQHDQAG